MEYHHGRGTNHVLRQHLPEHFGLAVRTFIPLVLVQLYNKKQRRKNHFIFFFCLIETTTSPAIKTKQSNGGYVPVLEKHVPGVLVSP